MKVEGNAGATPKTKQGAADNDAAQAGPEPHAAGTGAKVPDASAFDPKVPDAPVTEASAEAPARARAQTVAMPAETVIGAPPPVPPGIVDAVEAPTSMPGPRDIPAGIPTDPASPPGRVPRGDSRSLRRGSEFALVYRVQTCVISRFGTIGQRGQWRVVEYPTSSAASNAYAKECSRFVSEGFSDYRD